MNRFLGRVITSHFRTLFVRMGARQNRLIQFSQPGMGFGESIRDNWIFRGALFWVRKWGWQCALILWVEREDRMEPRMRRCDLPRRRSGVGRLLWRQHIVCGHSSSSHTPHVGGGWGVKGKDTGQWTYHVDVKFCR